MPISSAAAVPRIKPRDTSVSTSRSPHSKAPARVDSSCIHAICPGASSLPMKPAMSPTNNHANVRDQTPKAGRLRVVGLDQAGRLTGG